MFVNASNSKPCDVSLSYSLSLLLLLLPQQKRQHTGAARPLPEAVHPVGLHTGGGRVAEIVPAQLAAPAADRLPLSRVQQGGGAAAAARENRPRSGRRRLPVHGEGDADEHAGHARDLSQLLLPQREGAAGRRPQLSASDAHDQLPGRDARQERADGGRWPLVTVARRGPPGHRPEGADADRHPHVQGAHRDRPFRLLPLVGILRGRDGAGLYCFGNRFFLYIYISRTRFSTAIVVLMMMLRLMKRKQEKKTLRRHTRRREVVGSGIK